MVGDTSDAERDRLNKEVMDGKITGFLWLTNDALASHQILYSTKEAADFGQSSDLRSAVRTAVTKERLQQRGMNDTEIGSLLTPIRLETVRVEKGKKGTSGVTVFLTAFSMVFLLYAVVLVYGMAVMRSVIEEKSTRILEVLLSSVTAKELLAGKILGIGAVGLTQVLVWVIFATIFSVPGLVAAKSFLGAMHIPVVGMFAFAIFFLLGYLLYSCMYAAIGSMVNTDQEAQQMQWPAMMPILIAIFLMNAVIQHPNSTLCVLAFHHSILRAYSDAGAHPDRAAADVANCALHRTDAGHHLRPGALSARIYRVGILMYGKRPTLPELRRWLRYAG